MGESLRDKIIAGLEWWRADPERFAVASELEAIHRKLRAKGIKYDPNEHDRPPQDWCDYHNIDMLLQMLAADRPIMDSDRDLIKAILGRHSD